jgi:hypothetical protein
MIEENKVMAHHIIIVVIVVKCLVSDAPVDILYEP